MDKKNVKKVGYLGTGAWGYCLASLLALNGHHVTAWSVEGDTIRYLAENKEHPKMKGFPAPPNLKFTHHMEEALRGQDLIVEGVTSAGVRQVFQNVKKVHIPDCPIVLTSKGIEQNTGLLLTDVVIEVLGEEHRSKVGVLSGPSIAIEVLKGLPGTSVVCSGFDPLVISLIHEVFSTPTFRVYPNTDVNGVELGGALKNIIAIACGLSDGLGFGDNAKAALMTRGLHEMRKLAVTKGCKPETLNGLAGMGDLCVTCLSKSSRNYQFGYLLAEGMTIEAAKKKIGMVVEGTYTCLSAIQIAKKFDIEVPITEAVYMILFENLSPHDAVKFLLQRATKEEYL